MSEWNAMAYEGKDNVLEAVRREAEGMFSMAAPKEAWEAPTAATLWQVRDVIAHIVDTTEAYFVAFDAARGGEPVPEAYGLPGMAKRVNEQAQSFRDVPQQELLDRLRADFEKMMGIHEALTEQEWSELFVPHFYMGPLPAFFYPAFQLMDYGVHSWDIRQGMGRAHGLAGPTADLLTPFMFVLWKYTAGGVADVEPFEVGVRVTSGPNAADYRVRISPDGFDYEVASIEDAPVVFEFDPASLVLTAFGRVNGGTYRGDPELADRFLNLFFRI